MRMIVLHTIEGLSVSVNLAAIAAVQETSKSAYVHLIGAPYPIWVKQSYAEVMELIDNRLRMQELVEKYRPPMEQV